MGTTSSAWVSGVRRAGYRLVRLRGQGGCGQVWEIEHPTGERAALKILPCGDDRVAARELRGIQQVRRLAPPNFVRIDRVWAERSTVLMMMELADGSLLDLLDVSRRDFGMAFSRVQVCEYLAQAAEALDFLNARRHPIGGGRASVQHCDVKPSNLLLFGDTVKLCDFGFASPLTSDVVNHQRAGTLEYAAPEVFHGQLSRWTDQYSLAVSYCELRGGRLPFPDTPADFLADYVRPEPDLSMLSAAERPVIARALARAPQSRWPTCADMIAQLARASESRSRLPRPSGRFRRPCPQA